MATISDNLRVVAKSSGFEPSAWTWAIHEARHTGPLMLSTNTFANKKAALTAGSGEVARLLLDRKRKIRLSIL